MQIPIETQVWFQLDETTEVRAVATCNPSDQFCKRTGRKIAANRLLAKLRNRLSKSDRAAVFAKICPEYSKG